MNKSQKKLAKLRKNFYIVVKCEVLVGTNTRQNFKTFCAYSLNFNFVSLFYDLTSETFKNWTFSEQLCNEQFTT